MTIKSVVKNLVDLANFNKNNAYAILGAMPGPGIDLRIHPVEPLCGRWFVDGQTLAGIAFVKKFWHAQPMSNQHVAEMRKQATAWGLTFTTKLTYEPLQSLKPMVDPE